MHPPLPSRTSKNASALRRAVFQTLESRRLLASTLDASGLLTVNATNGNDDISLDVHGHDLTVTLNGTADDTFDSRNINAIVVNCLDGNDTVHIGAKIIGTTVNGNAGNDTLEGGQSDDNLNGGDGDDTIDGKEGSDLLDGGNGFDSADYRFETADLTLSIDGVANEKGGNAQGDNISLDVERIVAGSGSDFISGSDADNSITGRLGNDTIQGGLGNDSIDGDEGDDFLAGESGDDVLTGGTGNDTMTGGAGNDSFIANDSQADTLNGGTGDDNAIADVTLDTYNSIESGNLPAPEITVLSGATSLTDNASTVNFGSVNVGVTGPTRTFTVRNDGTDALSVGDISVPVGFSLVNPLVGPIQPGQSESFTLQVDTSVAGPLSGQVSFANSDADENPFNLTVTAVVNPAPQKIPDISVKLGATVIPDNSNSPIDFGSVNQNAAGPTRTFDIVNEGSGTLVLGTISVPAGFSLVGGMSDTIAPGAAQTFTVRMDTGSAGTKAGDITITSNDPDEDPFNFAITGQVVAVTPPAPDITVTLARPAGPIDNGNSTIEFGNRVVGSRGPTRTFRVRNDGKTTLNLGNLTAPAGFTIIDPLTSTLAPGEAESFVLQLDTSAPGTRTGFVSIPSNDPDESPFTFRVTGAIGVESKPLPEITINALQHHQLRGVVDGSSSFSFGNIAVNTKFSKAARTFRFANDGNATLQIGKLSLPAGFIILDGLPTTLAPGKTDNLVLAVDSTSGVGKKSGQITFTTNDSNENPFSFSVSATVTPGVAGGQPEISVSMKHGPVIVDGSATALSFGSVQRSAKAPTRTFRVRNDGNSPLTVGSISVPSGFIVIDALTGPIAPDSAESFTLQLQTSSQGRHTGQVTFSTNDSNENPFNFAITGEVAPPPTSSPKATASMSAGVLTVNGTSSIDTIALTGSSRRLTVTANGQIVNGSPFNTVNRIVVNGQDGDDRIDASDISIPVVLNGNNGNDTLTGGGGNDTLSGGAGDDNLNGGAGIDLLKGDDGNDTLTASDGIADQLVDGGGGNDNIRKDRTDPGTGT
jgi:Ca2+-binding RTX toxin-like protein